MSICPHHLTIFFKKSNFKIAFILKIHNARFSQQKLSRFHHQHMRIAYTYHVLQIFLELSFIDFFAESICMNNEHKIIDCECPALRIWVTYAKKMVLKGCLKGGLNE